MLTRLRPASIVAAMVLVVALGVALLPRLSLAPYPRLFGPQLEVEALLLGAGRDEVLARFTAPLERRLLGLADVDGVDSWTVDGAARLRVRGEVGADGERLRLAVSERLAAVELAPAELRLELLPAEERPLLAVAVVGGDAAARTAFARGVLVPELAHAGGGERIDVVGAAPLRVVVEPRQAALLARGLTIGDVAARLRRVGMTQAVGRVREGALPRQLVVGEEVSDLDGLRELRVPTATGEAVLRDVATVSLRALGDGDAFALDGRPAVLVRLFAARHTNAALAGWRLRRSIEALAARLPEGLSLRVVDDQGATAMRSLLRALGVLVAGVAAGGYLAWRRRAWRQVATAIAVPPVAMLAAVAAAALLEVALDPVHMVVLAAIAGALAWPVLLATERVAFNRGGASLAVAPRHAGAGAGAGAGAAGFAAFGAVTASVSPPFEPSRATKDSSLRGAQRRSNLDACEVEIAAGPRDGEDGRSEGTEQSRRSRLPIGLRALARTGPVSAVLLLAIAVIAIVVVWRVDGDKTTVAGRALEVRIALAPDLSAAHRMRASERFAAAVVRALPVRPRQWTWSLPRPPRVGVRERDDGVLRLEFADRREARVAEDAARRWLAVRSEARARVEAVPRGWLDGLDDAGRPSLWASAATAGERQASLARAVAELQSLLPSIGPAPPSSPGSEWHLAARARQSAGAWSEDLASALGGLDVGAVRITGVEPAIHVAAADNAARRLGLLAVRAGRHGSGAGVVPLAVAANVERVPRLAPLVRHDGAAAEVRLLLGVDAVQLARHGRRLAAASGATSRISLAGGAAALARVSTKLRFAFLIQALLVFVALVAVCGSLRNAAIRFAPVLVACVVASGGAWLAGGRDDATIALALLVVTPLAAVATLSSPSPGHANEQRLAEAEPLAWTSWGGMAASTVAGALVAAVLAGDDPICRALAIAVGLGLLGALVASRLLLPRSLRDRVRRRPGAAAPASEAAASVVGPPELA